MPGSGPPVPDIVLDAIKNGASFVPQKGEYGGLDDDGVIKRLLFTDNRVGGTWALDPDAGSFINAGTFAALVAWAVSASRAAPIAFDEGQLFRLGLVRDTAPFGLPIARVVVMAPIVEASA